MPELTGKPDSWYNRDVCDVSIDTNTVLVLNDDFDILLLQAFGSN